MIWDQQQNPNQSLVKLGFLLKIRCVLISVRLPAILTSILQPFLPGASDKYGKSFVNSFYRNKIVSVDAFAISPVSEDKVRASLSTLVNKDSAGVTCSILTHVINLYKSGCFPKRDEECQGGSSF